MSMFTSDSYVYIDNLPFIFQYMFEKYEFAGVYIAIQAVLTLYAQGNIIIAISWTCL